MKSMKFMKKRKQLHPKFHDLHQINFMVIKKFHVFRASYGPL